MRRRHLLRTSLLAAGTSLLGCCRSRQPLTSFQTLAQLSDQLRTGRIKPLEALSHYLDRIAVFDKTGPGINAILEINPDCRRIAARLEDTPRRERGPLHGLPILLKDNIDTADGMETTAGSLALLGAPKPTQDAAIVSKLRSAGMVILGKANLSEWANFRSPDSTSAWSARGGLTLNPHSPDHTASGSSSGSAAAVAAGLVPAAIGTETNGSIVSPASACGIVGLKPTAGLVSTAGIIPITRWQDTAGPMTLTCWDAALLMNVLAGPDPDNVLAEAAPQPLPDYKAQFDRLPLGEARFGILRSESGKNPQVLAAFDKACDVLKEAGATLVEVPELPNQKEFSKNAWLAMLVEFSEDLNAYLAKRGAEVASLAELIAFNETHRAKEMPHFGQEFFEQAESLNNEEARKAGAEARATARRLAGPEGLNAVLRAHKLDALISPTNDPAGRVDLAKGDENTRCACTPAAVAGYPHLTVPMAFAGSLPLGISFIGPAWSEARLLAYGHAFEHLMPARRPPNLIKASV